MKNLYTSGRFLFAAAIVGFGIIQFVTGNFMSTFLPVFESLPGRKFFVYLVSTIFFVGGLALLPRSTSRRVALLLGLVFGVLFIYPHLIKLFSNLYDPGGWTGAAEVLAFCGGSFIIAADKIVPGSHEPRFPKLLREGNFLFAVSLIVFGIQHLMYADFIATLIPSWIPFKVFWAYFIGVAFLATSLSLLINSKTRISCTLLGFMFLFWVIFLHAFRVSGNPQKETEWTSFFIAVGMCGIFFTIANQPSRKGL